MFTWLDWIMVTIIISLLLVLLISPIVAFFFRKNGFKKAWKITNICLLSGYLLIVTPIMVIYYYTDLKPLIEKMDQRYQQMKSELPVENSEKKVFVEIYQTGSSSNNGNRLVNFMVNNYNNQDFEGTIKISAFYKGEKIGEKEVELNVLAHEKGYSDYIYAYKLNIKRPMWNKESLKFEYELNGEFK